MSAVPRSPRPCFMEFADILQAPNQRNIEIRDSEVRHSIAPGVEKDIFNEGIDCVCVHARVHKALFCWEKSPRRVALPQNTGVY
jgi:hypothetical protein